MVRLQVQVVHTALCVAVDLIDAVLRTTIRRVERHDARVVVIRPVHRARSQPKDQPQHARLRVDGFTPDEGVERESHARDGREKVPAMHRARHAHDPSFAG